MSHDLPLLESAHRCETGAVRPRNEDACLTATIYFVGHVATQPFGIYVVADGMGGQMDGHIASSAAARAFADYVLSNLYLPLLRGRPEPKEDKLLEIVEDGMLAAHEAVYQPDPEKNGGSTLTAVVIMGRRLMIAHVGDSRAYLLENEELRALTKDHSLVRRLQDRGQLSDEDAETYEYRNVLLQALGQEIALNIDTFALDLPSRGKLLLCTDGLCGYVPQDELAGILNSRGTLQDLADRLYLAAMDKGGPDNITAVVVRFEA
jgi:PPM family protein phosphatase